MILAYLLDLIFGDPKWFYHPVQAIGSFIVWFQNKFYKDTKLRGLLLLLSTMTVTIGSLLVLRELSIHFNFYNVYVVFFLYTSLATTSLIKEVLYVTKSSSIKERRKRLSYIVSRNTETLDDNAIHRSLIETVAENTVDGILSPLIFIFVGYVVGYPVLVVFAFKAISTLDSMVGYKNDKYKNYGFFSAKMDDVCNFIPARLGSIVIWVAGLLTGKQVIKGITSYLKYRNAHDSPNAGHSESMVAGLLDVQLGGPNMYHGVLKEKPYIGNGSKEITKKNVYEACIVAGLSSLIMFGGIVWILVYMGQIQNVL